MFRKHPVFVGITVYVALSVCFFTMRQLQQREDSFAAQYKDDSKRKMASSVHENKQSSRENDSSAVDIVEIVSIIFSRADSSRATLT